MKFNVENVLWFSAALIIGVALGFVDKWLF
jgi:hypothetical protein